MTYRAMIFDIGGVIVPLHVGRAAERMASLCGLRVDEVRARLLESSITGQYERGEMTSEAFHAAMCELLGKALAWDQFGEVWGSIFDVETLIPVSFFEQLRRRFRMVLLSNTNALHAERLWAECGAMKHFDEAVLSFEMGFMKPDARIFEEAVRRAGCAAEECFYSDDIEAYVAAARQCGIDAVRFTGYQALREAMGERGILQQGGVEAITG
ncbi:MAG: HAD family phosphatase [Bryobacteraceae bacterium]